MIHPVPAPQSTESMVVWENPPAKRFSLHLDPFTQLWNLIDYKSGWWERFKDGNAALAELQRCVAKVGRR